MLARAWHVVPVTASCDVGVARQPSQLVHEALKGFSAHAADSLLCRHGNAQGNYAQSVRLPLCRSFCRPCCCGCLRREAYTSASAKPCSACWHGRPWPARCRPPAEGCRPSPGGNTSTSDTGLWHHSTSSLSIQCVCGDAQRQHTLGYAGGILSSLCMSGCQARIHCVPGSARLATAASSAGASRSGAGACCASWDRLRSSWRACAGAGGWPEHACTWRTAAGCAELLLTYITVHASLSWREF